MVTLKRHRSAPVAFVVPVANCIPREVFRHQENPSQLSFLMHKSLNTSDNGVYKSGFASLVHVEHKQTCRRIPARSASSGVGPEE